MRQHKRSLSLWGVEYTMNEALALSKLATKLLRDLEDIADSVEEDSAVHSQSIEVILDAFSDVDTIISQRKPEEPHEEFSNSRDSDLDSDADN